MKKVRRTLFKFQFRPMIGFLRSTCTFYRPKGMGLGVASDMYHPGSMKERVEASKSYPCLGGRCTLSRHSYYLPCRNRS